MVQAVDRMARVRTVGVDVAGAFAPRSATWDLRLLALGWVMPTAAEGAFERGDYAWTDHRALAGSGPLPMAFCALDESP